MVALIATVKNLEDKIERLEHNGRTNMAISHTQTAELATKTTTGDKQPPKIIQKKPQPPVPVISTGTKEGTSDLISARALRANARRDKIETTPKTNQHKKFANVVNCSEAANAPKKGQANKQGKNLEQKVLIIDDKRSDTIDPNNPLENSTINIDADISKQNDNETPWVDVKSRNKRRKHTRNVIKGTGNDTELQTVERVKKVHACFFSPDTTVETLTAYMKKKNPSDYYIIEKLKLKHEHYASFAITVPSSKFEYFMQPDNWPSRTEVSEWFRRSGERGARTGPRRAPRARVPPPGPKQTGPHTEHGAASVQTRN
ncbi:hypothetical protein O0L34_g12716 [Tuta absoluta]|nr:hypothetical protein O0L34_g12716 [Tuta absoluta]